MDTTVLIEALWRGVRVTLALSVIGFIGGTALGLLFGLARMSKWRVIRWPAIWYIEFFRTTPLLAQLVWLFFVIPVVTGIEFSAFTSGAVTLALNQGAYKAEMFRAGIQEVAQSQRDSAKVLGLTRREAFRYVVGPQALAIIFPPFVAHTMNLIKGSAYVSVIGVHELTRTGQIISLETLAFLPTLLGIAAVYFAMIYPIGRLGRVVERRTFERWRVRPSEA